MGRSLLPILILSACCIETSCFTPSGSTVSESSIRINRLDADMHVDIDINTVPLPSQVDNPVCDRTESKIRELPPVLQQIADERQEFQLNLGKAMDTLRKDMPEILKKAPGMTFLCYLLVHVSFLLLSWSTCSPRPVSKILSCY